MNKEENKISYDPDADVLVWELNDRPIAYAKEIRGIIIHFSARHAPVLIEVLEATQFLAKAKDLPQFFRELGVAVPEAKPQL